MVRGAIATANEKHDDGHDRRERHAIVTSTTYNGLAIASDSLQGVEQSLGQSSTAGRGRAFLDESPIEAQLSLIADAEEALLPLGGQRVAFVIC